VPAHTIHLAITIGDAELCSFAQHDFRSGAPNHDLGFDHEQSTGGGAGESNCDTIMLGLFHSGDQRFGLWEDYRFTCLRTRKFSHGVHGIEAEQGDEFDLVVALANEEFRAAIAFDVARGNAGKDFVAQQVLVPFRVLGFSPATPNSCDHWSFG